MKKKLTLEEMVKKIDDSKKVNPLDLSSDQDLSIALMNLVSLEEHFFFSGAKTKKTGFYDLINVVRNMRKELMERIVNKSGTDGAEVWCISKHLLAASMRLYEVGTKALGANNTKDAYKMFEKAYELYSLFWGLNMNMIDLASVKKTEPVLCDSAVNLDEKNTQDTKTQLAESRSVVQKLGDWVKKTVNCCIE